MICTLYAHEVGLDKIKSIVKKVYPKSKINITKEDDYKIIEVNVKEGFFSSTKIITIPYRERNELSYQIPPYDDCNLTANIRGMHGLVNDLEADDKDIQYLLSRKIETLNCEFSIIETKGETKQVKDLIYELAQAFDAILFVQSGTFLSRTFNQHFSNKNLQLLMDTSGMCGDGNLEVKIQSKYFEETFDYEVSEVSIARKTRSEAILKSKNIKYIAHLPVIESEEDARIREPKEIAERVTVLAMVNFVAFDAISGEKAIEILKKYKLWDKVTPKEKVFLINPKVNEKIERTWQTETIWTLLWALNQVETLPFPDTLCNLQDVENYPIKQDVNPYNFIDAMTSIRSKSEILDANDLHYRFNWACVNERFHGKEMEVIHPGIVYERCYALNWLIHYQDQDWDDVSCDT